MALNVDVILWVCLVNYSLPNVAFKQRLFICPSSLSLKMGRSKYWYLSFRGKEIGISERLNGLPGKDHLSLA